MTGQTLDRRQFIAGLAATPVVVGCGGHRPAAPPTATATPAAAPGDEWARVRAEFPLSPEFVHMAGFLLVSHPTRVREAIERHRRELDANPALYVEAHAFDPSPMLKPAAGYMGVQPEQIALTDSTTMGLALLYSGLPLRAGDEVLTTEHDHYSTYESLRLAALRSGATLRKVALYQRPVQATAAAMAQAIEKAIAPATRVVAITWVHSGTGVKTPVRAIADVVARANAGRAPDARILLCVDGVHGFGVEDATMPDLGCDFFVAGTHKWLFGPRGTGVIWGRPELWSRLRPTIPCFGWASFEAWIKGAPPPATTADVMTPGGFHSFEHRWALGEAFEFHGAIGKAKIAARIHELNRQCKEGLAAMKHVTLHTPLDSAVSAGIITFEVAGLKPEDVVKRLLARRIIASTTPYTVSYARLAPGLLNSPAEVDAVLREIRALA
jgi:selenocysteine lyase/cysteine desulfurase